MEPKAKADATDVLDAVSDMRTVKAINTGALSISSYRSVNPHSRPISTLKQEETAQLSGLVAVHGLGRAGERFSEIAYGFG